MSSWITLIGAIAIVAIVGTAGSAHAMDGGLAPPDDKVTTAALMITYGTTVFVHVYEARTTTRAIRAGARETNPLITSFQSPTGMVVFGVARAAAIDVALRSMGKRHKTAAILVGAALNFSYLIIAAHNNAVTNRLRD